MDKGKNNAKKQKDKTDQNKASNRVNSYINPGKDYVIKDNEKAYVLLCEHQSVKLLTIIQLNSCYSQQLSSLDSLLSNVETEGDYIFST